MKAEVARYNVGTSRIAELSARSLSPSRRRSCRRHWPPRCERVHDLGSTATTASPGNMTHFYDTQAWIPKNVTFVNKAAFDALDSRPRRSSRRPRSPKNAAENSRKKAKWYLEQLRPTK